MAYPVVDAAYGFKPINELNGLPYAGATRQIPIERSYATALFNGDLVKFETGTVQITDMVETTTSALFGQIGVFVGCSYTNPSTGQKLFAQYYPGGVAANDIVAYVVDDDRAVFKAVVVAQTGGSVSNSVTAVGYASQAFVGTNLLSITGTAGSTTTGNSKMAVSGGAPTNGSGNTRLLTSAPFRVVGIVPETGVTLTGAGTCSTTTITLDAAVTGLQAGMQFIVAGVANANAGDFNLVTNVNGTTVTISKSVTIASSTAMNFVGFPEVLVKWNQGYHSYQQPLATGI
jgi:hypothetical protein